MATPTIVRQINELGTLRILFERGPLTRADIARELGVTKSTITKVTAGLIEAGLVRNHASLGEDSGRIGRPGTYLSLNPEGAYFAGLEIGVDRLGLAVLDLTAKVVASASRPYETPGASPEKVLDEAQGMLAEACQKTHLPLAKINGLCVSVPGFVGLDGVLLNAPKVGWRDVPIKQMLEQRFTFPTAAENDANVSAFAEWYLTPGLQSSEILFILLESGVGGGLIASGKLVRGAHGLAGEIGHMPVAYAQSDGYRPTPLQWEDAIGKAKLLKAYADRGGTLLSVAGLREAMRAGDPAAVDTVATWARWLARGISGLVFAHDPDSVVVGGELASVFVDVSAAVASELKAMLPEGFPAPALFASRFQSDGCATGAAAVMHAKRFSNTFPEAGSGN
jgi:predicted NBD/HSP70 family sugar kinase